MKTKFRILNIFYSSIFTVSLLLNSCAPTKNVIYFDNLKKDTVLHNLAKNDLELRIRKNDLLSINIISPDPQYTPLYNGLQSVSNSAGESGGSIGTTGGFLVDNNGNITMYKLGKIHVEGLTRNELKQKLERDLSAYLKDAVINVRFLNNHVTMLGEVARPQVLTMPNEQLSILEALGMTGDLTFTGKRDNILVIRETENGKQFKRLNLNDKSIFYSSFFYLKPDDVVYVEPTKFKIRNSGEIQQTISYILSGLSIAITILVNLLRK